MAIKKELTIVVPVLNENISTMLNLLHDIQIYLPDSKVVVVDDHSNDVNTIKGFNILKTKYNVTIIKNNGQGQEMALYTGIHYTNTKYIACLDCDGQDPVSTLRKMFELMKEKDSFAIAGIRKERKDSIFRIISANIYHTLFQLKLRRRVPAISNYFIIHKNMKNKVDPQYVRGVIYNAPNAIFVPYRRRIRNSGKSRFTILKLWKVARAGLQFAKAGGR